MGQMRTAIYYDRNKPKKDKVHLEIPSFFADNKEVVHMSFLKIAEEKLNQAFTQNGDRAYATSGSYCLDYFALIGGYRNHINLVLKTFMLAFNEDPKVALKILFYARDIRNGLGERNTFRLVLNAIGNFYPEIAKKLLPFIPQYGRYDDLLVLLSTPVKKEVLLMIQNQLKEDVENKKSNQPYSLLAKWLPSINTSNQDAVSLANLICKELKMTKKQYRQTLSYLRKGIIVENNLREKEYTFSYENLPGGALFKYQNAFMTYDLERYEAYLKKVSEGKVQMNTGTVFPYQIVRKITNIEKPMSKDEIQSLDTIWNSFLKNQIDSKCLVVRDGSGSMTVGFNPTPMDVATSMAILMAEQLTGAFHNQFITFSDKPELVSIRGRNIYEKIQYLMNFNDCSNTNIEKVYQLILDVYKSEGFTKEDALDQVIIISDMEFDCLNNPKQSNQSTFAYFKEEFKKINYSMPQLVFWNVNASNHLPVKQDENGVYLISGASQNIINMIMNHEELNPYQFMIQTLEKYSFIDEIL